MMTSIRYEDKLYREMNITLTFINRIKLDILLQGFVDNFILFVTFPKAGALLIQTKG